MPPPDHLEPLPPEVEALIDQALAITEGDRLAAIGLALRKLVEDDAVVDARAALTRWAFRTIGVRRPRRWRPTGPRGAGSPDADA
jgi:hypothetical protein